MTGQSANEKLTFGAAVELLHEGFRKITGQLSEHPERARDLTDRTLLALAAWTEDEDHPAITAECRRRLAEHEERRAKFAAFGGDQLALIEDLDDDALWALARKILARKS